MTDEKSNPLTIYHDDLTRGLYPHIDGLVETFSQLSLISKDELADLQAQEMPLKHLLDVVHDRKEKHDSQCFDELIKFMKSSQDPRLSELADKMRISQDDDAVQCIQPVQSESSAVESFMPTGAVLETPQYGRQKSQVLVTSNVLSVKNSATSVTGKMSEEDLLSEIIQKAEKENSLFKMRFSTMLCIGLTKSGKTSFCNLLMDKTSQSSSPPPGNFHVTFIKKRTSNASSKEEEVKWREINLEELNKLISAVNQSGSLHNPTEIWDVLFLLDISVPTPALCLLQHSLVTFVTYKMLGEDFELNDPYKFIKDKKQYSKFMKEFLSSMCFKKKAKVSEFQELEITDNNATHRKFHTAFVGILDGSSSEESYAKEAKVINESLHIMKEHINCTIRDFPLSLWYTEDDNQYLHLVNVMNHKEKHFEKVKSSMEDIVAKNSTYKVPLNWMLLHFKMQQICIENNTPFVEYTVVYEKLWRIECKNSSEDELELALRFFHDVGALFYFHSIKDTDNFVITDLRWLFDNLKYLHNTKDSTSQYDYNARLLLKYEGELMSSTIEEIRFNRLGKMKPKDFVSLLEHLRFIAPMKHGNYFMPSILDSHEGYKVFEHYGTLRSKPLLITFSSGSLHRSVYCYLAAHISNNLPQNWSKPKYDESRKHQHTFKDLITFCVNINSYVYHVCILDKIFFLEIRIYSKSESDYPANLHYTTFTFIESSLKTVCIDSLQLACNDYKYGFLCCKCDCEHKQHLMIIKNTSNKSSAYCSKTDELEVLKENHTMWFYKRSSSTHLHDQATTDSDDATTGQDLSTSETAKYLYGNLNFANEANDSLKSAAISQEASGMTHNPNIHSLAIGSFRKSSRSQTPTTSHSHNPPALKHLQVFRKYIGDHWFDLGVEMLDDCDVGDLNTIKQSFPHNTKKCCTEMFQLWLSRCTSASWEDFIYALQAIELYDVVDKVIYFCGSNLRFSTPVETYDRSIYQYHSTAPVNAYGDHRQHRYSIAMASGVVERMELDGKRLDGSHSTKKESTSPKKKQN